MTLRALSLTVLVFGAACAPRYRNVVERPLQSAGGLECAGFLVWSQAPVRDVFIVVNGSGILSNAFVHPSFTDFVSAQPVAYATFDKPGIRAPFGDPAAVRRDLDVFERYTLTHGVACAEQTLRWARERFGPSVRLHLRGHSEGSLILLVVYDTLLERHDALADRISTLVLSGLAVEPFGDILERQLTNAPDGARQRAALESCDWKTSKSAWALSCAYVEDAKRRPSGRALFERLASRAPSARFFVFHGENDWNTQVEPVRQLEAWNAAEAHLKIEFHYYRGGHSGSDDARAQLSRVLTEIVAAP